MPTSSGSQGSGRPPGGGGGPPAPRGRKGRTAQQVYRRRRILAGTILLFLVWAIWLAYSLGTALTDPSNGVSYSARFAEWGRSHHIGPIITWLEKELYTPPRTGGRPPANAFRRTTSTTVASSSCAGALPAPTTVISPVSPALAGEGQWSAAGRQSAGCPAIYQTFVRPDAVHTSYVSGIVWMDPKLLSFTLYSGSGIPGGGPYTNTAPISPTAAMSLVSAFNAGFRMGDSQGGYYTDAKMVVPLVAGKASAVIYKDGTMNIGAWGSQVAMTPQVVSVRQNLDLIVNGGLPVPGLDSNDNTRWGATLGGSAYVWRSGMGITATGAIVYVGGPSLSITSLADLLVRAGSVRAMELDINTDWVQYSTYNPPVGQPASAANGTALLSSMAGSPSRYFASWWIRDFFTTSARYPANGSMASSSSKTKTTQVP